MIFDTIRQGTGGVWTVQLKRQDETNATGFAGSETLVATFWPGDNRATTFTATAVWLVAASGTVTLTIDESLVTSSVPIGVYEGVITITSGGLTVEGWKGVLQVIGANT
jgi:hypothetical protein